MSFPGNEPDNPQRVSAAVNTAGFLQDVVVATSRLLHGQPLTERDSQTLIDCRGVLRRILSPEVRLERLSERQLAATNTVALLRKARVANPEVNEGLAETAEAIDRLLRDELDEDSLKHAQQLRQLFLTLGEVNLAVMTRRDSGQEGPDDWTTLIASSLS